MIWNSAFRSPSFFIIGKQDKFIGFISFYIIFQGMIFPIGARLVQHFSFIRATAACEILKFLLRNLYLYFAQIIFRRWIEFIAGDNREPELLIISESTGRGKL